MEMLKGTNPSACGNTPQITKCAPVAVTLSKIEKHHWGDGSVGKKCLSVKLEDLNPNPQKEGLEEETREFLEALGSSSLAHIAERKKKSKKGGSVLNK